MTNSVRERFIDKIRAYKAVEPVAKLASVYTTFNEVWLDVRYSGLTKGNYYWFFIDTYRVNEWREKRRWVTCLICGDENTVVFLPDDVLLSWCEGLKPNRKGHWLLRVVPKGGELVMKIAGDRPTYDLAQYLNRYDFVSKSIPPPMERPTLSPSGGAEIGDVENVILARQDLPGASLHDKVVHILAEIGQWSGYRSERSFQVAPDSPYAIDVVWLRNDLLDVAIEVQVGGNEAEAKDRLTHARRFGARKVVVVSAPKSVPRLRSLCRYEPELKHWLEIWSIKKAYEMYLAGQQFYSLFRSFERQQWTEEITQVL
jgi:hypothetical protein